MYRYPSVDSVCAVNVGDREGRTSEELCTSQHFLAVQAGASQIILGTIFETDCKKGLQGKGVEFVRQICARCPIPVYAIGGMNLERISLVRQAGAAGGCMMSGFMKL